jgi:HAD superfamily hydrolase (TIGR01509 family)
MITNVFLDMDNTLIDSNAIHESCFRKVLLLTDINLESEFEYLKYKGLSTLEVFLQLGLKENDAVKASQMKSKFYHEFILNKKISVFPKTFETLIKLRSLNCKLFLCTAASKMSVDLVLSTLNWPIDFDGVYFSADQLFTKSDYRFWTEIINRMHVNLTQILVVDDSPLILEAASQSGLTNLALINCDQEISCAISIDDLAEIFSKFELS